MSGAPTMVIVDDHPMIRDGLRAHFAGSGGFAVVATGATADEAVDLCRERRPDVLLMDIEMPGRDALGALIDIRGVSPGTRVVLLSAFVREPLIEAAVRAGAAAYLVKSDPMPDIAGAVARVLKGEKVYSRAVRARMTPGAGDRDRGAPGVTPLSGLTPRQLEVLRYIGRGENNAQMARCMHLSVRTVERHVHRLMRTLEINDRTRLTGLAHECGLVR